MFILVDVACHNLLVFADLELNVDVFIWPMTIGIEKVQSILHLRIYNSINGLFYSFYETIDFKLLMQSCHGI